MKENLIYSLSETVGPFIISLLGKTLRIKRYGLEHFEQVADKACLLSTFHGRMFVPVWAHRHTGIIAVVSQSRDGEAVTRLVAKLGYSTVRGSSHRGGTEALRGMIEKVKAGNTMANLVDGPRGPFEDPKMGIVAAARLTGAPILPMIGASYPCWEFHSWDKFQLPRFFSRAVVLYGPPIYVPGSAKGDVLEEYRLKLKEELIKLRKKADKLAREKS